MPTSGVVETSKSKGVRSKGDAISSWHDERRHDPCAGAADGFISLGYGYGYEQIPDYGHSHGVNFLNTN